MRAYTDPRDATFQELYDIAVADRNVILLTTDTGAFVFKEFKQNIPEQFYNVGLSEQNAISVAAGLALSGKIVYVFGISSFVTLRVYEQIKIDICSMNLPVTILGMGPGYGYSTDGPTHQNTQDVAIMRTLPGMHVWSPSDCTSSGAMVHLAYENRQPNYIRIDKGPLTKLYNPEAYDFTPGMTLLKPGKDVLLITTSITSNQAVQFCDQLKTHGIDAGILDFYRLKPANATLFLQLVKDYLRLVTIEEHNLSGGLGSIVCELLADHDTIKPVKRIGIPDSNRIETGTREYVRSLDGIHLEGIVQTIVNWMP